MLRYLALIFTLLPFSSSFSQDTFSIVAVDLETGQVGSAGASCVNGSIIISGLAPGIGAINAQAWVCIPNSNLNHGIDIMKAGYSPQEVLDSILGNDVCGVAQNFDTAYRQYGIVDYTSAGVPRAVGFTGNKADDYKAHKVGINYATQGNILLGPEILDSIEARFLNTKGTFAVRLMSALQGANVAGADTRCLGIGTSSKSAFIRIALPGDTTGQPNYLELNVNATPSGKEPIDSLQTLFDAWLAECAVAVASFDNDFDTVNIALQEKVKFTNTSSNVKVWTWDFGDGSYSAFGDIVEHEYQTTGTFEVRLIAENKGCTDTATKTITVLDPTGISQSSPGGSPMVVVYPNPFFSYTTLAINLGLYQNLSELQITLYDISGHQVLSRKVTTGDTEIILSGFDSGMYLYKLTTKQHVILSQGKLIAQ